MDTKNSHLVQIGEVGQALIFYFEDYAHTYLKKKKEKDRLYLYGEIEEDEQKKLYIYGVAEETRLADKLKRGDKITNSELRRTLAIFREEVQPDQEG